MKNAATIIQMEELPKPVSASFLAAIVPVIMATARPTRATDGVGSGWKIRPRMVPTKMASMCMPRGSTPSGAGTNQRMRVTATMMATCTMSFVRLDFAAFTSSVDAAVEAAVLTGVDCVMVRSPLRNVRFGALGEGHSPGAGCVSSALSCCVYVLGAAVWGAAP